MLLRLVVGPFDGEPSRALTAGDETRTLVFIVNEKHLERK